MNDIIILCQEHIRKIEAIGLKILKTIYTGKGMYFYVNTISLTGDDEKNKFIPIILDMQIRFGKYVDEDYEFNENYELTIDLPLDSNNDIIYGILYRTIYETIG